MLYTLRGGRERERTVIKGCPQRATKATVAVVLLVVVGTIAIASLLAGCSMGTPTAAKEEASPPTTAQGDTPTSASDEKAEEVQPGPVGGNAPESPPDLSPASPPLNPGGAPEGSDGQLEDSHQDGLSGPGPVGAPPKEPPAPFTPDSGTNQSGTNDTGGKAVPVCPGPAAPGTARCHSLVRVR